MVAPVLRSVNRFLDHLEEWLIATLMGAATLLIFVAVVHRYAAAAHYPPVLQPVQDFLLGLNLSWAQELCIYMFVWMAKFGAAYGVRHGTHVGVDTLVRALPPAQARWLTLVGLLGGVVFTGVVGTMGAVFVWDNGFHHALFTTFGWDVGDVPEGPTSPDLEVPTWIPYACIPLASYLMCFRFLQVMWAFWRRGELPHHEVAHVEGLDDEAGVAA
ncbi:TRAP transporter small permease [Rhizobacter sp. OV335]|uniref:TRAP transporter small permease n=1 Tax=Rhizobacter sp. OV335 TaxID=1500264 RepID=UPI0009172F38|nr:TRAP transporter small permease [Rhizobacter sp. OV335]SHM79237.1 C4-dicarboxylate transporter, DctQ subunit [Rhizobacter sp. OV335]